ncbi:MAG TPA: hypothetical protein VHT73_02330 [Thermodesulfobacteriota bacterium]|nr:hypothetical protein [Thermodesulfobacteriota bacterium]
MKKGALVGLCLMLVFTFAIPASFAAQETIEGNVICLIPDYQKGTVNPVIADGPCKGQPPHPHILMTKEGKIYYLQGLQEGLLEIQKNPDHTDVKITGRVEQNPGGWVLYVE